MSPRVSARHPDTWKIPDLAEPRYSQSLERGAAILECFTPEHPLLGIADVAGRLGMSRSSTHRYMSTLVALGYLEQGERRKYRLTLRVTRLGMSALSATGLREHAHADLLVLSSRTGYATALATLDGAEVVYVDRVRGLRRLSDRADVAPAPGSRLPAHCVAVGKVLLAHLPERERRQALVPMTLRLRGPNTITSRATLQRELEQVREDAFAVEDEELAPQRIAIAAPLLDHSGEVTAAIELTANTAAIAIEELVDALGPHLVATADHISARLGYRRAGER
ncbi:MAG TPA: IclR family transcriptional regulator [Solirubrobacteraceae bacterium]|nr:IclR family transcriptional regulator [Solirubrobacteraceae bacterium]